MENLNLPAGLADRNVELFVKNDIMYATYNGKIMQFDELPEAIRFYFTEELLCDLAAVIALRKMGFSTNHEMLQQYIKCNYDAYDTVPDLVTTDRSDSNKEYWNCGSKGKCKYEGVICKMPTCKNGKLSKREMEVVFLLKQGKAIKEIADSLGTSFNTVRNQLVTVKHKLGVQKDNEILALTSNMLI